MCERPHVVFMQKTQSVEKLYLVSLKYNISQAERNEPLKYSLTQKTEEFSWGVSSPKRNSSEEREKSARTEARFCWPYAWLSAFERMNTTEIYTQEPNQTNHLNEAQQ